MAYAICILVAAVIAFAITWTLYKDAEDITQTKEEQQPNIEKVVATTAATAKQTAAVATSVAESNQGIVPSAGAGTIAAPMSGKAIAMTEVSDPVFASEAMGKGAAIEPTEGKVFSPVDGSITMIAETGHAIGLLSDSGTEVLIHIGIDTVTLKGAPFTVKCQEGRTAYGRGPWRHQGSQSANHNHGRHHQHRRLRLRGRPDGIRRQGRRYAHQRFITH